MHANRLTQLLLVALSAASAAQAFVVNPEALNPEVVDLVVEDDQLLRRQVTSPTSAPTTGGPPTTSSDPKPTTSPTTSKPPTSAPTSPTSSPTSSESTKTSQPTSDKTSDPPKTTDPPTTSEPTQEPTTSTVIITTHASDGSPLTLTSASVHTPTPSLNQGSGPATTTEMTQDTKNIIIGTVVGIGGAIVLGVAGYLGWRIWGKKKAAEENDGLMSYGGDYAPEAKAETTGAPNARTPFQSTLESYHAPTQVNTASNF